MIIELKMKAQLIHKEKADRIISMMENICNGDDPNFSMNYGTSYISNSDETLYIYRDVDDYTVHATISMFYNHKHCYITYSPAFRDICGYYEIGL